jgi:hypothetical protein
MANILEFLRGVLTDAESQRLFRSDPEGFVTRAGFGDLTGEDVVEAVAVLRRSLLPHVAAALADFEDETRLPAVRPSFNERELDAALRQLHHAVDLTADTTIPTAVRPAPEPTPEPEAPRVHDEPIHVEAEPELADAAPAYEPPSQPAEPAYDEPMRSEPEPAFAGGGRPSVDLGPGPTLRSDLPSVQALGAAITAASADVRSLLEEYAEEVFERLSSIVEQAERDAAMLRAEADSDREQARKVLVDARDEAERIRADAIKGQADIDARRGELRDAERELKDRLAGLDAVFRTVLKDE